MTRDLEVQPAFGRSANQRAGDPAPVPRVLGLGAQAFGQLGHGLGLAADGGLVNDGPGCRLGAGFTWCGAPDGLAVDGSAAKSTSFSVHYGLLNVHGC